jgi:hypothetical protein
VEGEAAMIRDGFLRIPLFVLGLLVFSAGTATEESADGKVRITGLVDMLAFDDRSQHASNIIFLDPKNTTHWFAVMDRNDYSLGGFQKLCK